MAGFSLSADELVQVCQHMRTQSDRAGDQTWRGGAETGALDFGGADHAELARLYGEVLDDVVPRMLREFQEATSSVLSRLEGTLATYLKADDDAAGTLR
ncbi:hypothetical protein [Actinophytocola sp.]|jgi:hypothetical protein|uniref:hypothetical protein n=1 Tax=Actinophytocola sp. TaxID=1872138 RepID=UPI002EDA2220